MIDSDANVLDSAFVNDYYLDIQGAVVTEDNKLVISGSKAFPNHKDVFVYKFNQDLEFDTLYNMTLNYDWICDLIIYQPEIAEDNIAIDVYPNPACDGIYLKINEPNELQYLIQIIGMDGAVLKGEYIYLNELKYFSLHDLSSGMYIITVTHNNQILSSKKIIKSR
ncbi:MAG: T9SS type A sorting domain-containing protein [Lentimicrobium sp.]|nr:T9SS type A sorting domain-containing protein [Lentimicrobium sp.]